MPFDDGPLLPDAEAFPLNVADTNKHADQPRTSIEARQYEDTSESAEAPVRRRRLKTKAMPLDERMELRNADLAGWKDNYVANMVEAVHTRQNQQATRVAKKNAAQWVAGIGLGDAGNTIGSSRLANPLGMFAGNGLLKLLTGVTQLAGQKRDRGDFTEGETDSEARRQRMREDEVIGRGDDALLLDDDMAIQMGSVSV